MARSCEALIWHWDLVLSLFYCLGLQVNVAKPDLSLTQDFIFVSLLEHGVQVRVLTPDKVIKLCMSAAHTIAWGGASCWKLQKFLGLTNFAAVAVPRTQLPSCFLQCVLSGNYHSSSDCFRWCPTPSSALLELQWWASLQLVSKPLLPPRPSVALTTNISCLGWRAVWGKLQLLGRSRPPVWDHINALELQAVLEVLWVWAPRLRIEVVAMHCNNQLAVSHLLLEGCTHSLFLMELSQEILLLVNWWHVQLQPFYLPGIANLEADALSGRKEVIEWYILPGVVHEVFQWLGQPQIDLSTSQANADLQAFDTLHQPWDFLLAYTFPLLQLIMSTLAKLTRSLAALLLVTPWWTDAGWFRKTVALSLHPRLPSCKQR